MRDDRVCVAALDRSLRHVRPQLTTPWTRRHLRERGPTAIGSVIAFEHATHAGSPPEIEDVQIETFEWRRQLPPERLWGYLQETVSADLSSAFGPSLTRSANGRAFTPLGIGACSLACISPIDPQLVRAGDSLRIEFADATLGEFDLAVTDLRLWGEDGQPRSALCNAVARRLAMAEPTVLSVGLTRAFAPRGSDEPRHWLQVNNIHFHDYFDDHPTFRTF